MTDVSSKWFVRPQVKPEAKSRLFFFPYAGGGPTVFTKWCADLPSHIEGIVVHYPGRGSRFNEPVIKDMPRMVTELSQAIQPLLDLPFAFFGHSMGGLIAFELARKLRVQQLPMPNHLFVSACGAPHLPDANPKIHQLPDEKFLNELDQLNGIPAELKNPEAMSLLLPIVRADFQLAETYEYHPDEPFDFPISAFGALDDPRVNRERIEAWSIHTKAKFVSQFFPGNHFFINETKEDILKRFIHAATGEKSGIHAT
jgi:medium-chain acyl-[acyl-carrier-protein] hydrolase